MKKLWSAVDTAVSASAAQLKSSVWNAGAGDHASSPTARSVPPSAGPSPRQQPIDAIKKNDNEYLRLPVSSARKLRWYDNVDLHKIVQKHIKEKQELEFGLCALKKILIRMGVTESDMDIEIRAVTAHAEDVRRSDEGVASVLLTSCMAELEDLQQRTAEMQEQVTHLNIKLQQYESGEVVPASQRARLFSLDGDEALDMAATQPPPRVDPGQQASQAGLPQELLQQLISAITTCEDSMTASTDTNRRLRSVELDLSAAEALAALAHTASHTRQLSHQLSQEAVSGGWDVDTDLGLVSHNSDGSQFSSASRQGGDREQGGQVPSAALIAKLQRVERERDELEGDVQELKAALAAAQDAAARQAQLLEASVQAQEQIANLSAALEVAQSDLHAAKAAAKSADELASKRGNELRRLQHTAQGADALRKLQDAVVEAEEKAGAAIRRCTILEARCNKAETALNDKTKQVLHLQAEVASLTSQLQEAQRSASQSGTGNGAAAQQAAAGGSKAAGSREVVTLKEQLRASDETLRATQKELSASRSALAGMEAKLHASEAREARLLTELRETESVQGQHDALASEVLSLRDKLSEGNVDRTQLKQLKQMNAELAESRAVLQEELLVTGQLVTQLDARLMEALNRAEAAEAAAQVAESKARQAASSISQEVEQRLHAAGANKAMWPAPAKDEISRLEARLAALTASLAACQEQVTQEEGRTQQAVAQQEHLASQIDDLKEQLRQVQSRAEEQIDEITVQMTAMQREIDQAHAATRRAEAERAAALHRLSQAPLPQSQHNNSGGTAAGAASPSSQPRKWQVQNVVGGGSLYGVSDLSQLQQVLTAKHSTDMSVEAFEGDDEPGPAPLGLPPRMSARPSQGPFSAAYQQQQQQESGASASGSGGGIPRAPSQTFSIRQGQSGTGSVGAAGGGGGGGPPGRVLEGLDVLYLKNVLLKFMEAALAGKVAERDALLPAVATLLQATPAEFQVLKKVVHATAPPATQMLSAMGLRLPGFS